MIVGDFDAINMMMIMMMMIVTLTSSDHNYMNSPVIVELSAMRQTALSTERILVFN